MSRVDPMMTAAARRADPTPLLTRHGLSVRRPNGGRHLYARDGKAEAYRITLKEDGHYVTCDKFRGKIGDNIALLQHLEPGTDFQSAVAQLLGLPQNQVFDEARSEIRAGDRKLPKQPRQSVIAQAAGRSYLHSRGISIDVILDAEDQGFLGYVNDGVLTLGRDVDGVARWISKRFLAGLHGPEGETKRDFFGSEKRYAAILNGRSKQVQIVEGGTDALGAHCRAKRCSELTPTMIVTGGSGCLAWIDEPHILEILLQADEIVLVYENELNDAGEIDQRKQALTDRDHDEQASRIEARTGKHVTRWRPPAMLKDIAAVNQREIEIGGEEIA